MIIEFIGLPGAGKSSLERALLVEFNRRGWGVMSRAEAIEALALDCSPFPRDRGALLRRLSTLCYKFSLMRECIAFTGELLAWRDILHLHRMRALMRVLEDLRLHRLGASTRMTRRILNLSEGLGHHLVALRAWRRLLAPTEELNLSQLLASSRFAAGSLLVYIVLPVPVALARLNARGVPALWPATVEPADVLQAFIDGLSSLLASSTGNERLKLVRLDGGAAQPDWRSEATTIAHLLSSIEDDELTGARGP